MVLPWTQIICKTCSKSPCPTPQAPSTCCCWSTPSCTYPWLMSCAIPVISHTAPPAINTCCSTPSCAIPALIHPTPQLLVPSGQLLHVRALCSHHMHDLFLVNLPPPAPTTCWSPSLLVTSCARPALSHPATPAGLFYQMAQEVLSNSRSIW